MRTPQAPLPSGFDATTRASELARTVDLTGKLAVVTGGAAGLGLETTRALTAAGATVVVPARDLDKARRALGDLPRVEPMALDLADPASIDAFAANLGNRPLHILINNAGIMAAPLQRDARGYEQQLATNHLGHFQLTAQLWPALVHAGGARVVNLSSRGHVRSPFVFDDPMFERRTYDKWDAYGQSKTANVLFSVALDERGARHGVRAFAVHPGGIVTELMRHLDVDELQQLGVVDEHGQRRANDAFKTPDQGAATSVWCATSPALRDQGGVYCEDVDIAKVVPLEGPDRVRAVKSGVAPWAIDLDAARRLWTLSEQLTVPFAT